MTIATDKLKSLDNWARAGFIARGVVYILFGFILVTTGQGASKSSVIDLIRQMPAGDLLLGLMIVGLIGYALFRFYEAAFDLEDDGDGWKGIAKRLAKVGSGLVYGALAFVAVKGLLGKSTDGESAKEEIAKQAVDAGGSSLLLVSSLIILGVGLNQLRKAWTCDFWWQCSGGPDIVKQFGRFGYAARAAVMGLVGVYMLKSGLDADNDIRTTREAIDAIRGEDGLVLAIGVGLVLFGLFSLALARFRNLPKGEGVDRAKAKIKEKLN